MAKADSECQIPSVRVGDLWGPTRVASLRGGHAQAREPPPCQPSCSRADTFIVAGNRITVLGAATVFAAVASPVLALLSWRERGGGFGPNLAVFLAGAALGWFIVWGVFRWFHQRLAVWSFAFLGIALGPLRPTIVLISKLLGVSAPWPFLYRYLYGGRFMYGLVFGASIASFRFWRELCVRPLRMTKPPARS